MANSEIIGAGQYNGGIVPPEDEEKCTDTVVVPVEPTVLPEDQHNCDWEGCSTLNHVVRFSVSHKYTMEARLEAAEAGKQ